MCILYTKSLSRQKWYLVARAEKEYPVYLIKVAKEKCNGCDQCLDFCPVDVFEIKQGKSYPTHPENCLGCGTCVAICETQAIIMTEI
ncbi:MAG: 4Fe-4S binding protein [Deltaproteobacteria bacterium]|nr:MAG: 4Fe-4S binding protein [Deltaproteobacteria bacterium]